MAYLIRQKFNIGDLVNYKQNTYKVLIHEPEEYLSALYGHYLQAHNFDVKHCPYLETLREAAEIFHPKLLIFNAESQQYLKITISWLESFKKNFPEIYVVTTGFNTGADVLKKLMSAGSCSHFNRQLTRPQDIAVIAKNILYNY